MPYIKPRKGLSWMSLSPDLRARTCGYWYTVQSNGTALTAFRTRAGFLQWLSDRGLAVETDIPAEGEYGHGWIAGEYREALHLSYDDFYAVVGPRGREMSNSQYTLSIISSDADGIRTVHTLNPNCRDRPVFDRASTDALIEAGTPQGGFPEHVEG